MVLALDDDELEEEEEELDVVRSAGLLFRSLPQLLHYVTMSLPPAYKDEEDEEEEGNDIRGELTALRKVGEEECVSFLFFLFGEFTSIPP